MPRPRLKDCPKEAFVGRQFAFIGGRAKFRRRIQGEVTNWAIENDVLTVSFKWTKKAVDAKLEELEDVKVENLSFSLEDFLSQTCRPEEGYACLVSLSMDYLFFIGPENPSYIKVAA